MNRKLIALGAVAALVLAYLVAAPWITVYQIKSAAEAHDDAALAEHVDFDSVRQSLKDQLHARLMRKMTDGAGASDNPLAALVAPLAGAVVDKAVDWYVTPAGVIALMSNRTPDADTRQATPKPQGTDEQPLAGASMAYSTLDTFIVRPRGRTGAAEFVLRRRGLGWKLTAVVLPGQ
ncbi:MAG: hypothetical protein ABS45_14200 [Comamonas sp. SCN 65-56]|uniref:DUF2939 domain-containing protein n=1 Tax=Comamonas sp. SCN 65-56 TaxID=1660095 RepID=UPI00086F0525|nr:DUF2939 domain-containing protein [Comamonas sp. SCN 65-56]ODS90807.1 MAG: hypothetical protein ABS45_14200 [Comamonas sp. SCN 65-56]